MKRSKRLWRRPIVSKQPRQNLGEYRADWRTAITLIAIIALQPTASTALHRVHSSTVHIFRTTATLNEQPALATAMATVMAVNRIKSRHWHKWQKHMHMRRRLRPTGNERWQRRQLLARIIPTDLELDLDLLAGLGPMGRLCPRPGHKTAARKD